MGTTTNAAWLAVGIAAGMAGAGCGEDEPRLPEEGNVVGFLRPVHYSLECFDTPFAANRVFRDRDEWRAFFLEYGICYDGIDVRTAPPEFDFDRHALIMVLHEGDCAYSGCGDSYPLITQLRIVDGKLAVFQRQAFREELSTCLACVQPRDFALIDAAIADAFDVDFRDRSTATTQCF